jgi:para-nitrobenzyl esterase
MSEPVIETSAGRVRGRAIDGVVAFKAIPYGAPPIERLRFQAPRPREPWSGVRDATAFAPSAFQPRSEGEDGPGDARFDEDCLALNVWSPDVSGRAPVMVWLHGGAFTMGSGSQPQTDGAALARAHDVVVVSLNHRLGALGFLHAGDLLGADYAASGNAGMLDIVLALSWVKENISNFGGDPANVTIFGVSGGGSKVLHLLAMPEAEGLFHGAIVQSGANFQGLRGGIALDDACAVSERFFAHFGLNEPNREQIFGVAPEEIVAAQLSIGANFGANGAYFPAPFVPVIDGVVLPASVSASLEAGASARIPVVIGTNLHEATYLWTGRLRRKIEDFSITDEELSAWLAPLCGEWTEAILDTYRATRKADSDLERFVAIASDFFRVASSWIAELKVGQNGAPVFNYLFSWESPVVHPGAVHGLDAPFVFKNLESHRLSRGANAAAWALSEQMASAWSAFAHEKDPSTTALSWPAFDLSSRQTMIFDEHSRVEADPLSAERAAWSRAVFAEGR